MYETPRMSLMLVQKKKNQKNPHAISFVHRQGVVAKRESKRVCGQRFLKSGKEKAAYLLPWEAVAACLLSTSAIGKTGKGRNQSTQNIDAKIA